jgi:hypothetical protein
VRPTHRTGRLAALAAAFALAGALTGCGTGHAGTATNGKAASASSPTTRATASSPTTTPTSSPAASPATSPSTGSPSASSTTDASPPRHPAKLSAGLLTAAELPGLGPGQSWRVRSTAPGDGADPPSVCMHAGFHPIGAVAIYRRDFSGGSGSRAVNVLARFADNRSAVRTYKIFRAWHDGCRKWLTEHAAWRRARVDRTYRVRTSGGEAFWWLSAYGPVPGRPRAAYFEATGLLRVGSLTSLVVEVSTGQDYRYPRGQEPMVAALKVAAKKLG